MTIEQKAQRYDEAIERAKKIIVDYDYDEHDNVFMEIFPQLRESKDEMVKSCISMILTDANETRFNDFHTTLADCLTWLEKQGEPTDINPSEFDLRLNKLLKQFEKLPKEELESSLTFYLNVVQNNGAYKEKQGEQKPNIWHNSNEDAEQNRQILLIMNGGTAIVANIREPNHNFIDGERWAYVDDLLEKQGEHKQVVEIKTPEESLGISCEEYNKIVDDCIFGDDKVKPKFKVGKWYIDNEDGTIFQIVKVLDNTYTYKTSEGKEYSCSHYSLENDAHLWTIQDAKDGDVLVDRYENIGIFEKTFGIDWHSYCYLGCNGDFMYNEVGGSHDLVGTYPATKEQRAFLFSKMKEAGYEWDTKKKELKKIEQKFTQETEPFEAEHGKYYYCIKDYFCGGRKQASKGDVIQALRGLPIMGLKNASEYFLPVNFIKCNSAWSEEDEIRRNSAIEHLEESILNTPSPLRPYIREDIKWLRTLKERVQPQPKQEWSEEDSKMLESIKGDILNADMVIGGRETAKLKIDWLKSLKQRIGG